MFRGFTENKSVEIQKLLIARTSVLEVKTTILWKLAWRNGNGSDILLEAIYWFRAFVEIMHLNTFTNYLILLPSLNCALKQSEICVLMSEPYRFQKTHLHSPGIVLLFKIQLNMIPRQECKYVLQFVLIVLHCIQAWSLFKK